MPRPRLIRFQPSRAIFIALFGLALCGCKELPQDNRAVTLRDNRSVTTMDSWYSPQPIQPDVGKELPATELDKSRIHPVVDTQETWAEALLAITSFAEITAQQGEEATGTPIAPIAGTKLYLVRGVYLNRGTGGFDITLQPNNDINVFHGCLGNHPVPMKRQSLVLQLDKTPHQVFVDCGMIE
jgi:hypothetical protein